MAETKVQNPAAEQRGVARRQEYNPSSEFFNFSPFAMMRRLSEDMERAFSSNFGVTRGAWEPGAWAPPVEVRRHDGTLEISAELPGMTKEDVKVECADEGLIIEGEKRREHESDVGGFHRSERSYGRFYRFIPLPDGAQADKAKAEFKNGILEVHMPVAEQQNRKNRQIPINT